MRSGAQVYKVALLIERNHCVLRQIVDQLNFVRLVSFFHILDGLSPWQFKSFKGIICLYDLLHLFLDLIEIFFSEFVFRVKVIIKSVIYGRPYGQLGVRPEMFYGLGHYMRRRVAIIMSYLFIFPIKFFFCHFSHPFLFLLLCNPIIFYSFFQSVTTYFCNECEYFNTF